MLHDEPALLSQMKVTCIERRALYFLLTIANGVLNTLDELAEFLGKSCIEPGDRVA